MIQKESELFRLVEKYNVSGPRYTSYPTSVHLTQDFNEKELMAAFEKRRESKKDLSLYFHIPFCFSLCWYCGCTKIITKDQDRGSHYLNYIEKEARLISNSINSNSEVKQIHFGGGTPTFLSPEQLHHLGRIIQQNFRIHEDVEYSVEIDPRRCTKEHILALKKIGVNRASLGVQDTNSDVQQAIHRIQPFNQTKHVTQWLRDEGIESINFDLIYGLPRQTESTFQKTIDDVISLNPDRLAIYSYAHLPSVMPAQKLLDEAEFPTTNEKLGMLLLAIQNLPEYGFNYIGMDHFAQSDDELSLALEKGTLQRNFQGYSTHSELEMIAMGMSGISQGDVIYYQNEKDLATYYHSLDDGKLPIKKVLKLSDEDRIRRKVIMQIMCKAEIDYNTFYEETGLQFEQKFSDEIQSLTEFEADGLVISDKDGFQITPNGRLFLRNIAMVFDGYLNNKPAEIAYSKTV